MSEIKNKLTKKEKQEIDILKIKEKYESGVFITKIAKEFNVSEKYIYNIAKKNKWIRGKYKTKAEIKKEKALINKQKKYDINDIKREYESGTYIATIVKKYKIHLITIKKLSDKYGWVRTIIKKQINPKQKEGFIKLTPELLQQFENEHKTYAEITKITGISECSVRSYKKRWNIIPNKEKKIKGSISLNIDTIKHYYIELNYPIDKVSKITGYSISSIARLIKKNNLKKPKELKNELRKKTTLQKYGVEFTSQIKSTREKAKETNLKKYGNTCSLQAYSIKEKSLKTMKERYGKNIINISQINLSQETIDILNSKEKMYQFITENKIKSCHELADVLQCNQTSVIKKIHKYKFEHMLNAVRSYPEQELSKFVSQYFTILTNTRATLPKRELDIYIPDKQIAIEFNGNYYHSDLKIDKMYHFNKSMQAENHNIFIYHIFEYEWNNNKKKILNQLSNLLGINQEKIPARKCKIKEVKNKEKNKFLNDNHIQGEDKSTFKYGLFYKDELVSLMTFAKPRFNKKYQWELSRYCSKANCNVIGGASKLFKHFIKTHNPESIISYSDIAKTRGKLYETLGFKLISISNPNYVWCKQNTVLSRYQCQKSKLLKKGFVGNTEDEIMKNQKFNKIYDCGNKVWVWKNK